MPCRCMLCNELIDCGEKFCFSCEEKVENSKKQQEKECPQKSSKIQK